MMGDFIENLATALGGKVESRSDEGAVVAYPLPPDHWIYTEGDNYPPAPFRIGVSDPLRETIEMVLTVVARFAIRASTANGTAIDFDLDAMVQNFIVGFIGYYTPDGK